MNDKNEIAKRKQIRLENYDYSSRGAYFITICTEGRRHILSEIVDDNIAETQFTTREFVGEGFPLPRLSEYGKIVDKWIKNISVQYPKISVERYVIMPNHIHLLLFSTNDGRGDPSPTVTAVMGWFKYQSTKEINATYGKVSHKIWQRSFYDHVIRNQHDYDEIVKYIYENPLRWHFDDLYAKNTQDIIP